MSYGPSAYVESALTQVCAALKSENTLKGLDPDGFAKRLAHYYVEMDAIHPFREGNSRTLRQLTGDLAAASGYRLDWSACARSEEARQQLLYARDLGVMRGDSSQLSTIVRANLHDVQWERQARKLMADELVCGNDPVMILDNWSRVAPEKGDRTYFRSLLESAMVPENIAGWQHRRLAEHEAAPPSRELPAPKESIKPPRPR